MFHWAKSSALLCSLSVLLDGRTRYFSVENIVLPEDGCPLLVQPGFEFSVTLEGIPNECHRVMFLGYILGDRPKEYNLIKGLVT